MKDNETERVGVSIDNTLIWGTQIAKLLSLNKWWCKSSMISNNGPKHVNAILAMITQKHDWSSK